MVEKINNYYKKEIDKVKVVIIKDNMQLKNPYLFVFLNILGILLNITLLSKGLKLASFLLYTLPLFIGLVYEIHLINQYKKSNINEKSIEKILRLIFIKLVNALLFCIDFSLVLVEVVMVDHIYYYDYSSYVDIMNKYYILCYAGLVVILAIMFVIGYIIEKKQVIKGNKKFFVAPQIISFLAVMTYFKLKKSSINLLVILFIVIYMTFPYALGRCYFRYKHFNKKVSPNNTLIDYEIYMNDK